MDSSHVVILSVRMEDFFSTHLLHIRKSDPPLPPTIVGERAYEESTTVSSLGAQSMEAAAFPLLRRAWFGGQVGPIGQDLSFHPYPDRMQVQVTFEPESSIGQTSLHEMPGSLV